MYSYLFWLKFNFESIKIKKIPSLQKATVGFFFFPFLNNKNFCRLLGRVEWLDFRVK